MNRPCVLLTWVAVNAGAEPLLEALDHPRSELRGRVSTVYLCHRVGPGPRSGDEKAALKETITALERDLQPQCPDIKPIAWKTEAPPTDHAALRPFVESVLRRARNENPEAELWVHLSPGTPAMHAVWLALCTTGFVEGPLRLVQGTPKTERSRHTSPLRGVDFSLGTYLKRYRATRPSQSDALDDGRLLDPLQVRSPALQRAVDEVERWSLIHVPVLLIGERGTGKTTMAHLLRSLVVGESAKESWPTVVCGQFQVDAEHARSELFGHSEGAFTGAKGERRGLLEEADGDCVLFDEIGDLDRKTQRMLIAAVEGRGFARFGESKRRHPRFRLLAATNRELSELAGGLLDADFFDRISTAIIEVPPLRACREDLPYLWSSVFRRAEHCVGTIGPNAARHDERLLARLADEDLPGNLRDLERLAFEVLVASAAKPDGDAVAEGLLRWGQRPTAASDVERAATLPLSPGLDTLLLSQKRRWVARAMAAAGGNKSRAAALLGVGRSTFRSYLRSIGEDGPADD